MLNTAPVKYKANINLAISQSSVCWTSFTGFRSSSVSIHYSYLLSDLLYRLALCLWLLRNVLAYLLELFIWTSACPGHWSLR